MTGCRMWKFTVMVCVFMSGVLACERELCWDELCSECEGRGRDGGVCGLRWKKLRSGIAFGGEMLDGLAAAIRSATLGDGVCLRLSICSCSLDLSGWRGLP